MFDFFDENDYEVFDDDEAARADRAVHAGLYGKHDAEEQGRTAKPTYEIPVDIETTEADFIK